MASVDVSSDIIRIRLVYVQHVLQNAHPAPWTPSKIAYYATAVIPHLIELSSPHHANAKWINTSKAQPKFADHAL
jgi:hypothetical protein